MAATATLATLLVAAPTPAPPAVAAGSTPPATGPAPPVPHLDWEPCGDLDCATAAVPLDYDRPAGSMIKLLLARRPADDQDHRIGTLFVDPGGPGASGTGFVRHVEGVLHPSVLARFDVVGFDPRGVAHSTPATCFESPRQALGWLLRQPLFPVTEDEEARFVRTYENLSDLCAANGGRILPNMSTGDVARDLDLLRQAVGDERLTYVGYSYGTMIGQTYVNLFPGNVRAVVIDGVIDPREWVGDGEAADIPFSTRIGSAEASYEALQAFLAECEAAGPATCAFAEGGDPRAKFDALADRLRRAHLDGPDGEAPLRYDEFVNFALGGLFFVEGWAGFAATLQSLYEATEGGVVAAGPGGLDNFLVAPPAVWCLDTANPRDPHAWAAAAAEADRRAPYFGRLWTWSGFACASWPFSDPDDRYAGPWDRPTSAPVLVVGTRFDPSTPYEAAEAVADLLPNARLLTLDGYGHTSIGLSSCVDRYVAQYLLGGALPSEGATCRTDVVPFADAGAGAGPPGPATRADVPRPLPPGVVGGIG